jgi:hypothetical protein
LIKINNEVNQIFSEITLMPSKSKHSKQLRGTKHPKDEEFEYLLSFIREYQSRNLSLELAGIFFVAAVEYASAGNTAFEQLNSKLHQFRNVFAEFGTLDSAEIARNAIEKIKEDHLIDSLWDLRRIEILYEPVVRHYSLAIISVITSAETFINEVAEVVIEGNTAREYFDKLPIQAKWLFLPKLMGMKCNFSLDKKPLQDFSKAVKIRNALIHFKGRRNILGEKKTPAFLVELGLLPKNIKNAIDSVRNLIRNFSLKWHDGYGPDWLYTDEKEFRRPCFFIGDREASSVLWADDVDRDRIQ